MEGSQFINIVSSIVLDHINNSNLENKPSLADIYLKVAVEFYANILEELNCETQKNVQSFVQEISKKGENEKEDRICKMIYIILSFGDLQGNALKKLAMNLLWLDLPKDIDLTELQAQLYNLAVEIEFNQKVFDNLGQ